MPASGYIETGPSVAQTSLKLTILLPLVLSAWTTHRYMSSCLVSIRCPGGKPFPVPGPLQYSQGFTYS